MPNAFDELTDFLASGPPSAAIAEWQPSDEAKMRVADLIDGEKAGSLSAEEASELEHLLELEHVMRMTKAKARLRVARRE